MLDLSTANSGEFSARSLSVDELPMYRCCCSFVVDVDVSPADDDDEVDPASNLSEDENRSLL